MKSNFALLVANSSVKERPWSLHCCPPVIPGSCLTSGADAGGCE